MPASIYRRSGSRNKDPLSGSGGWTNQFPIDDSLVLKEAQEHDAIALSADSAFTVTLVSVVIAHVLIVRPVGGWCKVTITTTDGTSIVRVPANREMEVSFDETAPLTAITLTRPPGVPITVQVFLGEKS